MKLIPTYETDAGDVIQFRPINNVPGFTHRVIINRHAVDYLGDDHRPSAKAAQFFIDKHGPCTLSDALLGGLRAA